ncbi:MAG: hypothetical protein ACNA7T_14650 [Haliea sp.]
MIYIWTRATLDWQDERAFQAQLPPSLVGPVHAWNSVFKLPFHLFRHRVRQIALTNHSSIVGAACSDWEAIPDGSMVVPVDDDDWFAPELAEVLEEAQDPSWHAYLWPAQFLEVPVHLRHELGRLRRQLFPAVANRHLFSTNNYAMAKIGDNATLLRVHTKADAWYKSSHEARVRRLETPLSMMNRTLGSTTTLREKTGRLARTKLLLAARRYRKLYQRPTGKEFAWAKPYREAMAELMDELY